MKYIDLAGLFLDYELLCVDDTKCNYQGSTSAPIACVINGRLSYFYNSVSSTNPVYSLGAKLISIDDDGTICTYVTPDLIEPFVIAPANFGTNISISGNTIQWFFAGGNSYRWVIPPYFFSGKTVKVNYDNDTKPSPCGSGDPFKTIITSNNVSYEFIRAFPESDDYWASIYDLNNNLLNSGFIGNSPNDLFDRTSASFPPYVTGTWLRNGYNLFNLNGTVAYVYQVFGWNEPTLIENNVPLACGVPNYGTYIESKNKQQFYLKDYGLPASNLSDNGNIPLSSICDISGAFIQQGQLNGQNKSILYYNKDYYVILSANQDYYSFPNLVNNKIYVYKQNRLGSGLPTTGGTIYVAKTNPLIPYGPLPVLTSGPMGFSLVNMSRPVSPIGAFRT